MEKISNTHCEVCLRKGVKTKVRTICKECREFLCKECSDTHLLHKLLASHTLIDLDPPGEEPRSTNEDELASDFLEQATVSETTVLYRAQVAVESTSRGAKQKEIVKKSGEKTNEEIDITKVKPIKCREFSVKRPDDKKKVTIRGILVLDDKVVVVDKENKKLKLYRSNGDYLSSTELKNITRGITQVNTDTFATCGSGNKVFLWTLRGDTIVSEDEAYDVDHTAHGIHYNNTYYCVLHHIDNAVTILDRQGRRVRKIVMKEAFGKKIVFGIDIHMDSDTHNICIPCWPDNSGVLCISVEGEALWFTPLNASLKGITEIHGALCIAHFTSYHLHVFSKNGEYKGKILNVEKLGGSPDYICYDEHEKKLYVSFDSLDKKDKISVFSLH